MCVLEGGRLGWGVTQKRWNGWMRTFIMLLPGCLQHGWLAKRTLWGNFLFCFSVDRLLNFFLVWRDTFAEECGRHLLNCTLDTRIHVANEEACCVFVSVPAAPRRSQHNRKMLLSCGNWTNCPVQQFLIRLSDLVSLSPGLHRFHPLHSSEAQCVVCVCVCVCRRHLAPPLGRVPRRVASLFCACARRGFMSGSCRSNRRGAALRV